ncbi:WcaI family glycosyltransferase [Qipengyuania aquimaris]|uniref:WcaI family glycosyltransferase n=1 Tax=Qipengyuania aquimaris TaxID=255984 RepID=A0A9Q3S2E3_9SPHN|nr:WcaI family glycosyltransferase [Qipengyuania aquimaris]MBY6218878.1 WcaI family glycosyltransferase [Qipengyuania aquimaris]
MAGRKILFIGLNYAPEPIGIGPYSAGLAEALVERGHEVRAIVGQPYYPDWKLYPRFERRWKSTVEGGVNITRCPHYIPANPTGSRRIAHHASFASSAYPAARRARREMKPDLVFAVAPGMIAAPVALRMARRAGVPLWLHVQDFEVGAALATGLIDRGSRTADAAARFEDRMLHSADLVSTISHPMCELLREKGVAKERILEMRNWANHSVSIAAGDPEHFREAWGVGDRTVALYSGNIANKQGLNVVIEAARLMVDRKDVLFIICGEGPNRKNLEALAQGLPNVIFHDLQPEERMGDLLTMADIHLLPQLHDAADLVLPSKLGNMLASGRPVVATVRPGTGIARELVGSGIVVPPETPAAIVTAIEALTAHPDYRKTMGDAARERARTAWSKESVVDCFEEGLERLLG